jgi:Tetratricopeptide repeat
VLDAACAWKLGSLAFKLLALASKAVDHEAVATFLEIGATSVEAGEAVHDRQRDVVRSAAARLQAQIERNSDQWLRAEFGSDPSGRVDAAAAIAALDDILPRCLPEGLSVAQANLDAERIAGLVVAKAALGDEMFRTGKFGERLLRCLVRGAYEEAKRDPDFATVIGIPVQQVLLGRTEQLITGQAAMQERLAELLARFPSQIAATSAEYKLPREVVDRLLMTADLADIEPELIPSAFEELARRFASMQEALRQQSNQDPEIATLRQQASDALAAADLDAAERLLAAIRERQRALSERRRRSADEARADFLAALEDESDTCGQQAGAALLRLDAAAATRSYQDGITVLAEASAEVRWRYALGAADSLREFGDRAGRRDSLLASIDQYSLALRDADRDRVPLDWARTKNNLGVALATLGERESGTARLEAAVAAHRAALEERTRARVPLEWAGTQNNLGNALARLGERESGTARLEEAVAAFRAALEEWMRDRVPLQWAGAQNNLGNALATLGARESGTTHLEEAVVAHRAALEERTRHRVPLDWAMTQINLGAALQRLGERESGTTRLEEAVAAYRAALEEYTRDRVPLDWAMTQNKLGMALGTLGARESGTAQLEEAVAALHAALEERTRDRVPLPWATTQNNLGDALAALGARESETARLEEAVATYCSALEERTRDRMPIRWAMSAGNQGVALALLAERLDDSSKARAAVEQIEVALATMQEGGHGPFAAYYEVQLTQARALLHRLAGG